MRDSFKTTLILMGLTSLIGTAYSVLVLLGAIRDTLMNTETEGLFNDLD